ncbi:MAG TPA: carbohydrate kinase [Lachnospiraceae bacterium]|nr:carbohydrate kinase [Lachnospiraceae bacterium]
MLDIYSIGEMVIDFIPGNEPGSYVRNAGGAPANVAIAAAKNHLKSGMCCKVGDDSFGRFLIDTLRENKVEILCAETCKAATTTMAFVNLSATGERTFTFARKPGADMFLSEEDVRENQIENAVIVHAGSCSLSANPAAKATEKALRLANKSKRLVSFDVNYRNLMWNNDKDACTRSVKALLPCVDLLKISEEEVDMMGGEGNLHKLMEEYDVTVLVETLGKDGARAYFKNKELEVPGRKVKAEDATGAGDAFWGGFLSSLRIQGIEKARELTEENVRRALEYGNAAGYLCVQKKGAIAALPTKDMIEEILASEKDAAMIRGQENE